MLEAINRTVANNAGNAIPDGFPAVCHAIWSAITWSRDSVASGAGAEVVALSTISASSPHDTQSQ